MHPATLSVADLRGRYTDSGETLDRPYRPSLGILLLGIRAAQVELSSSDSDELRIRGWADDGNAVTKTLVRKSASDAAGRFSVSEMKELFFSIPLPDMGKEFHSRICVTKDGYAASVSDPWSEERRSAWFYELPTVFRLTPVRPTDAARPYVVSS